jgi:hypothetical protein
MTQQDEPPNAGQYHEIMDRASMVLNVWVNEVHETLAVQHDDRLRAKAGEVARVLGEFYQIAGDVYFAQDDSDVLQKASALASHIRECERQAVAQSEVVSPGDKMDLAIRVATASRERKELMARLIDLLAQPGPPTDPDVPSVT